MYLITSKFVFILCLRYRWYSFERVLLVAPNQSCNLPLQARIDYQVYENFNKEKLEGITTNRNKDYDEYTSLYLYSGILL